MVVAVDDILMVGHADAAHMLGIAASTWYALVSAGKTPAPRKLGRRVLWMKAELTAWAEAGFPDRERWSGMNTVKK